MTILEQCLEMEGFTDMSPLEQLRFFCSMTMEAGDWVDSELFFDNLEDSEKEILGKNERLRKNNTLTHQQNIRLQQEIAWLHRKNNEA